MEIEERNRLSAATPGTRTAQRGFFRLRPVRIDFGDVLVQIFAVALGVVLGSAVTAWNERLHQRTLLRETVNNIAAELRSNQTGMHAVLAQHTKIAAGLTALVAEATKSASLSRAQVQKAAAGVKYSENIPLGIAWQIAQNNAGLALLPYEERYDLAWIYQVQSVYYATEQRFGDALLMPAPAPNGNYYFQVVALANEIHGVVALEKQLDGLYTAARRRADEEYPPG